MADNGQYDSQINLEQEEYEQETTIEQEDSELEITMQPEAATVYDGSVVNSINGQVGDVILTTSDLENTSDYQTGAQVQSAIAGKQDKLTAGTNIQINNDVISATGTTYSAGSGLNLSGTTFSVDTNTIATVQDVSNEATTRENSDANLQGQIDALTVSSDVIDVLGTYQDLQNYDTSHVKANDIIKVLQDSTHNNAMSYYRWVITDHVGAWVYVGSEGPYYTKSEADALLDSKQNEIADLPQIRSGAEAGATAVQPEDLARIATTGSYNDSLDKPSINNVVLTGNKSLEALGIQPKGNYALESEIPDVSNFITNTVDNLVNYYKKSETFTKQEVNDLISAITTMDIQVVQTLPTEDISTTTIYLVPKATAGTNDAYDEYIYVSNAWEHIGSTEVDLTNYVTNTDYATNSTGGVFKVSSTYGLAMSQEGILYGSGRTYAQYQSAGANLIVAKGTLENVFEGKSIATKSDIPKVFYGTSATAAGTATKVVVCEDFTETDLVEGTRLSVYFTNANTYNGTATLNVNSTGAKNIYYSGTATNARYMWVAGETVDFIYNGEQWVTTNGGLATTTYYGVTKLSTGANSDSQVYALTPRSLYYFANYSIAPYYSTSKTYEVGDKVRYNYYIYECITAIETPEAWTAAHWQEADTIQEQIDAINTTIGDIDTTLTRLTTGSGV